jgi:hypothetical protein
MRKEALTLIVATAGALAWLLVVPQHTGAG